MKPQDRYPVASAPHLNRSSTTSGAVAKVDIPRNVARDVRSLAQQLNPDLKSSYAAITEYALTDWLAMRRSVLNGLSPEAYMSSPDTVVLPTHALDGLTRLATVLGIDHADMDPVMLLLVLSSVAHNWVSALSNQFGVTAEDLGQHLIGGQAAKLNRILDEGGIQSRFGTTPRGY